MKAPRTYIKGNLLEFVRRAGAMVKYFELGNVPIGTVESASDVDELCLGRETLQVIHGTDVTVGSWRGNRRQIQTDTPMPSGMPAAVRACAGNSDRLRMTIRQHRVYTSDPAGNPLKMAVHSKLKMHVLGAELCGVRPMLSFSVDPSMHLTFGCKIKMYAIFPPPLNSICERFMLETCKNEIALYVDTMREAVRRARREPPSMRTEKIGAV